MRRELQQIYDIVTDRNVINFIASNVMLYNYPYLVISYKVIRFFI